MRRAVTVLATGVLGLALTGCGESCESVKDKMTEIGEQMRDDPERAWKRGPELQELGVKFQKLGCLG
ncbi:MAG: hypothetical protein Tsb0016_25730 [Sphingomonadales bacterium]